MVADPPGTTEAPMAAAATPTAVVVADDVSTTVTEPVINDYLEQTEGSPLQDQSFSTSQSLEHPSSSSKLSSSHSSLSSSSFPSPQPYEHFEGVPLQVQSFSI